MHTFIFLLSLKLLYVTKEGIGKYKNSTRLRKNLNPLDFSSDCYYNRIENLLFNYM